MTCRSRLVFNSTYFYLRPCCNYICLYLWQNCRIPPIHHCLAFPPRTGSIPIGKQPLVRCSIAVVRRSCRIRDVRTWGAEHVFVSSATIITRWCDSTRWRYFIRLFGVLSDSMVAVRKLRAGGMLSGVNRWCNMDRWGKFLNSDIV